MLLLAALDTGWRILEPVRLSLAQEKDSSPVYHILLDRSPSTDIRLLTIPANAETETFMDEESLQVWREDLAFLADRLDADGRFVTALLRPARRPNGVEIRAFLRRLTRAIRSNSPNVQILVRADSHYACPEVFDWCEANGLDYVFGLAPTRTLKRHVIGLEDSTSGRFRAAGRRGSPLQGVLRRRQNLEPGPPHHRPRRGRQRRHRYPLRRHQPRPRQRRIAVSGSLLPARPSGKPHQGLETHLAAHRTSCPKATANQFRLFLHAGAYWLLWSLRAPTPRRSSWRVAQFDTLRGRLIKTATRVVEMKSKIKIHLPTSAPDQAVWHLALGRLPRLII